METPASVKKEKLPKDWIKSGGTKVTTLQRIEEPLLIRLGENSICSWSLAKDCSPTERSSGEPQHRYQGLQVPAI